jgi:hypothetical protein
MFLTAVVRAVDDLVFLSITQTRSCALLLNAALSPHLSSEWTSVRAYMHMDIWNTMKSGRDRFGMVS